jgi:hypothetical protein
VCVCCVRVGRPLLPHGQRSATHVGHDLCRAADSEQQEWEAVTGQAMESLEGSSIGPTRVVHCRDCRRLVWPGWPG